MTNELKNSINEIASMVRPAIDEIHSKPATTKNYYGDYMAILSPAANNSGKLKLLALGLICAGANITGVQDAVKLLNPSA